MDDRKDYDKARRRAGAKLGLYLHFAIYVATNIVLIAINFATTPQYLWFAWPLLGWGVGVLFHGLGVFVFSENSPMMKRMIDKELKAQDRVK